MLRIALCLAVANGQLVLPARDGSFDGPMLVLLGSDVVPPEHYEATVASIQRGAMPGLWAAVPATGCEEALGVARAAAAGQGWRGDSLWLAGHGSGSACAEHVASLAEVAGLVFLGALPSERFDLVAQATPTLIASTELHGGEARPGRAVAWWRQYLNATSVVGPEKALREKPVVILPKLNNSNFCPGFDMDDDLMAEVSQAKATEQIGELVGSFVAGKTVLLSEAINWTASVMTPFLAALDLEHLPTGGVDVNGSSPFCEQAQYVLSGLSAEDQVRLELTDFFGPRLKYDWAAGENPDGTLMHCHNSNETLPGGKLTVKVCSYAGHNGSNSSSSPRYRFYDGVAAGEMGCKLMSSEFLAHFLNTTAVNPNTTCRDVNAYAVDAGTALASSEQLERFQRRGRSFCVMADAETPGNIGPLWIDGTVNYTETEQCLQVSGFHLKLGLDAGTGILDGVEYCKAMSPAFVLDYILTGSMKPVSAPATTIVV